MARDYESIDDFFDDISSLNEELQLDERVLPKPAGFLINNGNILIEIMMDNGGVKEFYFNIENKKVVNIFIGKPEKFQYVISTNEKIADEIIASKDKLQTSLLHYKNKDIKLKSVGFGNKIKSSFARFFVNFL